jgi:mono/diheme cytochrome c family protein
MKTLFNGKAQDRLEPVWRMLAARVLAGVPNRVLAVGEQGNRLLDRDMAHRFKLCRWGGHIALIVLSGALFLSACSLAGDITPPPGAAPLISPTLQSEDTPVASLDASQALPIGPLSAAEGAAVYAEHCAACHGETGNGDGPMAAQLSGPPPKFADSDLARRHSPQEWFAVVTQGRLDKFMPPFNERLTDAQRWNVVAFLYALSVAQDQIEAGQSVYGAQCAACHGPSGKGDGPEASGTAVPDLTQTDALVTKKPADLFAAITTGLNGAHTFTQLPEEDRWAVVDYVRTFAYEYLAPGAPLPTKQGAITGSVLNGTLGAPVPAGLPVTLLGFDGTTMTEPLTATVDSNGDFVFEAVPYQPGRQFILTTDYAGVTYHSSIFSFASGQDSVDVSLRVYEVTDDPASLRVTRMHTFLLFETSGEVTVGQLFIFTNNGDKAFAPENGRSVRFTTPAGAADLTVQNGVEGQTYVRTADGFEDTRPVPPGEGVLEVLFSYRLPYSGELNFDQPVAFPVDAINVLVGDANVTLTGQALQNQGLQNVEGRPFQSFSHRSLKTGERLTFKMSGAAAGTGEAAAPGVAANNTTGLVVGLVTIAVALLGVGLWLLVRARSPSTQAATTADAEAREDLLQALAELDDDLAAGKVSAREHERERARLKAELMKFWKR